jgi:hypothetical protein
MYVYERGSRLRNRWLQDPERLSSKKEEKEEKKKKESKKFEKRCSLPFLQSNAFYVGT